MARQGAKVKTNTTIETPVKPSALLRWYDRHRRILPWRALAGEVPDPYRVWLSEIMLQQTTVIVVAEYFKKFMARWPTVQKLAAAERDDVLRMWAGLGYYRRAHLLHECAKKVCEMYDGKFPATEAALLQLPGIGPYTAAAIVAIAFDKPANVVDGNVDRVISRVFNITTPLPKSKPAIRANAAQLAPAKRCGDYAQALMDLGATICTPRSPLCERCPWQQGCVAYQNGTAAILPRKEPKLERPVRHTVAFIVRDKKGRILLQQRPAKGLLGGMTEVPSSPWENAVMSLEAAKKYAPCTANWREVPEEVQHVFSHFTLKIKVLLGTAVKPITGNWIAPEALKDEALPSVMRKIVRHGLAAL